MVAICLKITNFLQMKSFRTLRSIQIKRSVLLVNGPGFENSLVDFIAFTMLKFERVKVKAMFDPRLSL